MSTEFLENLTGYQTKSYGSIHHVYSLLENFLNLVHFVLNLNMLSALNETSLEVCRWSWKLSRCRERNKTVKQKKVYYEWKKNVSKIYKIKSYLVLLRSVILVCREMLSYKYKTIQGFATRMVSVYHPYSHLWLAFP